MTSNFDVDVADALLDDPEGPLPNVAHLAALITATRAEPTADELVGEAAAMAAFRVARPVAPISSAMRRRKLVAGIAVGVAVMGLGTGLAAAGNLPGPAQDAVATVMHRVGVDVPDSDGHPGGVAPAGQTTDTNTGSDTTTGDPTHPDNPSVTAPGQDPNFNPGQSGDDHGNAGTNVPPGNPDQTTGNPTHTTGPPADPGANGNHNGDGKTNSPADTTPTTSAPSDIGGDPNSSAPKKSN